MAENLINSEGISQVNRIQTRNSVSKLKKTKAPGISQVHRTQTRNSVSKLKKTKAPEIKPVQADSLDDFEEPKPKKVKRMSLPKKLEVEFVEYDSSRRLRLRNALCGLHKFIEILTDEQKEEVKKFGFGSILDCKITSIPTCLGYWLLSNYNPNTKELNLGTHKIKLTRQLVNQVLGIPLGSIKIVDLSKPTIRDPIVAEFRNQYPDVIGQPELVKVKNLVETSKHVGRLFELNFLVVFVTMMGKMTQGCRVNTEFLTSIKGDIDIKSFDWCSYIISCLDKTKLKWNGYQHYNGPVTFLLLLYAHDKYERGNPNEKHIPAISYNDNKNLIALDEEMGGGESKEPKKDETVPKVKLSKKRKKRKVEKDATTPKKSVNLKIKLRVAKKSKDETVPKEDELVPKEDEAVEVDENDEAIKENAQTVHENEETVQFNEDEDEVHLGDDFIPSNEDWEKQSFFQETSGSNCGVSPFASLQLNSKPKNGKEWVCLLQKKTKELDKFVEDVEHLIKECFQEVESDDEILEPIQDWMSRFTKYKNVGEQQEDEGKGEEHKLESLIVEKGKEEDVKEEYLKGKNVKEKDVKDEDLKEENVKEENLKEECVKDEDLIQVEGFETKAEIEDDKADEMDISLTFEKEISDAVQKAEMKKEVGTKRYVEENAIVEDDMEGEANENEDIVGNLLNNSYFLHLNEAEVKTPMDRIKKKDKKDDDIVFVKKELPKPLADKGKRTVKVSEALRSPYRQRIVQLDGKRVKEEEIVSEWVFATQEGIWDIIFDTELKHKMPRISFESFHPSEHIHIGALNCWAVILNNEEQYRSTDSPTRLFCPCNMLVENYKPKLKMDELLINFEISIESVLISSTFKKIKEVDLLFIPSLHENHYIVICVNFKKYTIIVIDNMKGKLKARQNVQVKKMKEVLVLYLEKHAPSFGKMLKDVMPTKIEMPWQTEKNYVDCGIFAMRHMETYLGKPISEWSVDCGLSVEKDGGQKAELNELRTKYMTKILLSDINVLHDQVIAKIEEFEKLDHFVREKLKKSAHKRIVERKRT